MQNNKSLRGEMAGRFSVLFTPEPNTGCWLWLGALNEDGYGKIRDDSGHKQGAHRASWLLSRGPIPDGKHVLHSCDNPQCVNPAHLWLGSHADNMADCKRKRRGNHRRGERVSTAKLTEADVRMVLEMSREGVFQKDIAKAIGIKQPHVSEIVRGKSWKHLGLV